MKTVGKTLYHFHFLFFSRKRNGNVRPENGNEIDNIGISETGPSKRNIPILVRSQQIISESAKSGIEHREN